MKDSLHSCLDGELPRDVLSPAEDAELLELEAAIAMATSRLKSAPVPDLTGRVMADLPDLRPMPLITPRDALSSLVRWVWAPKQVAVRPAYLFAGAMAMMLLALSIQLPGAAGLDDRGAAAPSSDQRLFVQFRLDTGDASTVALAGSFTEWQPHHDLREVAPGVWTALIALEPGVHDYLFVVDGEEWIPDPVAHPVDDGFGGTNSRLFLASPSTS
ncbi:hypothetical protein BH23GEM6_BH23GEM6_18850 [soil metagenome]